MARIIFFLLPYFFACSISAQTTMRVNMQHITTIESVENFNAQLNEKSSVLHGLPTDLDTFLIWSCPVYYTLQWNQLFKEGKMKPEVYNALNIDIKAITEEKVNFAIDGITGFKNGKKVIIVDANNNQDLSDDEVFTFDTTYTDLPERLTSYKQSPILTFHYDYYYDGQIIKASFTGKIQPSIKYSQPTDKILEDLAFSLRAFHAYQGTFQINKNKYNIFIDGFTAYHFKYANIYVSRYGERLDKQSTEPTQFKQPFLLDEIQVTVDSFDLKSQQIIVRTKETSDTVSITGGNVGMIAPKLNTVDINGKDFSLEMMKDKFVLINFWGTWCGPCKADHDELKNIYRNRNKSNLEFLGIAADNSSEKVNEYINDHQLLWNHVFTNLKKLDSPENIAYQYHVREFPTYFLVSPDGKIKFRGGLEELKKLLIELKLVTE